MLYLCLAILSSALVAVLMRLGSGGDTARKPLLAVNYLTCAAVSVTFLRGGFIPRGEGAAFALALRLLGGALYLGALLLLQRNVRENGVTLSSAFMKLGVIVPTALGLTLFREPLNPARVGGILLTLAAIALLSAEDGERRGRKLTGLVLLMLCGGMADGLSKFYEAWGNPAMQGHFLCFVFSFAMLLCAGLCAWEGQRPTVRDWLFGVLLGVPNYFSSRFLLLALDSVPASVAYPVFSCGTILLTALIGRLAFGERPGSRQFAAIALVLLALVLLNV